MARPVMPPLVLEPLPVSRPWGGRRAHEFLGRAAPSSSGGASSTASSDPIGEWWLLSTRADHPSTVASGPFAGKRLLDLLAAEPSAILGPLHAAEWSSRFPLLVKLLDTAAPLSIQTHPSDADLPGEGKTETWYLLAAEVGAKYWLGLAPGKTPGEVVALARARRSPLPLLAEHAAHVGDVAHVEAGTIHALGGGIVALEFQTTADTTYRVWDWDRRPPRPLHLDEAQKVARLDARSRKLEPRRIDARSPPRDELVRCDRYFVERLRLRGRAPAHLATNGERFEILVPLHAGLRVAAPQGAADVPRGHAALVAAETTDYVVTPDGDVELLRCAPLSSGATT